VSKALGMWPTDKATDARRSYRPEDAAPRSRRPSLPRLTPAVLRGLDHRSGR
jgi:hypothetical protein